MLQVGQGGTITLRVQFQDGTGALTDPANPRVAILDPVGAVVESDLVPVRDSLGSYHYDYAVAADAQLGDWTAVWTGSINGVAVQGNEEFEVVGAGMVLPAEGGTLLTVAEYKAATGQSGTQDDARIEFAVEAATEAIINYTGRGFLSAEIGQRTFIYDGGGFLEIDDCHEISSVRLEGLTLTADLDYFVQPFNGPVYTWLDMGAFSQQSPALGFTRNLDQPWGRSRLMRQVQKVDVTATWGWPYIPKDVKQAAVWVAAAFMDSPKPFISESIANYAVTRQALATSIPDRAQKILDLYMRVQL